MARLTPKLKLEGYRELDKALNALSKAITVPLGRRAVLETLRPIANIAEGLAPVNTGRLSVNIEAKTTLRRSQRRDRVKAGDIEGFVGPTDKAWYGMFQEFGTRHHPAQGFMRYAWEKYKPYILPDLARRLWYHLDLVARKR